MGASTARKWHEYFKARVSSRPDHADFDDSHIEDGYAKWSSMPNGRRVLIGSTTGLTVLGMAAYLSRSMPVARAWRAVFGARKWLT